MKEIAKNYKMSYLKDLAAKTETNFSAKTMAIYILLAAGVTYAFGAFLRLQIVYMLCVLAVFILCLPFIVANHLTYEYQPKRVDDLADYMSKLIYAYQKTGKIRSALEDVEQSCSSEIRFYVSQMIEFIENATTEGNVYSEAFKIIENAYGCSRLNTLHRYLVEVEMQGGLNRNTLDMLLNDIREWTVRNMESRSLRKSLRIKILLSVVLSFSTCVAVLYMIPSEYAIQMVAASSYQIGTMLVLMFLIVFYVITSKVLSASYLDLELDNKEEDEFYHAKERLAKWNPKRTTINSVAIALIGFVGVLVCQYLKQYVIMIILIVFIALLIWQPYRLRKRAKKKVVTAIEKAFPIWMRNIILQLKTNNVYVSIANSTEYAPYALKDDLDQLVNGVNENPGSIIPFDNFCKEQNISEIRTSVNFLYYLSEFGNSEMHEQLNYLIKQNDHMTVMEEKLRDDDTSAFMGMLILIPMVISMAKLLVDMYTMLSVFTTIFMNAM